MANSYATGEEAMRSKETDNKGKSKGNPESSKPKDNSDSSKKSNNNRKGKGGASSGGDDLAAAVDRPPHHCNQRGNAMFKEIMGQTYELHGPKAQYLTQDCSFQKKLAGNSSAPGPVKKDHPLLGGAKDMFPEETGVWMIFGGSSGYESRRCQKLMALEVNAIVSANE